MKNAKKRDSTEIMQKLKEDLHYLVRLCMLIDGKYGKSEPGTYHYIKSFRKILDRFNEKYHGIHAVLSKNSINLFLRFFVRESNIDNILAPFQETGKPKHETGLNVEVEPSSENTYAESMTDTVALKKNPHRSMVELIYNNDSLQNEKSPEFKILFSHAMADKINEDIDLRQDNDNVFCFDFDPEDYEDSGMMYSPKKYTGDQVY